MKFKVGDKVKVRSWEDMRDEFGTDDDGDIIIKEEKVYFLKKMLDFCGTTQIISAVRDKSYFFKNDNGWHFTEEMFEPVIKKSPKKKNFVLDEVERAYLSNIVGPKSIYNEVDCVVKDRHNIYKDQCYIYILFKNQEEYMEFPRFPRTSQMYKGMKEGIPYTLRQLGIKRKENKRAK